jgi:hypothetical protein
MDKREIIDIKKIIENSRKWGIEREMMDLLFAAERNDKEGSLRALNWMYLRLSRRDRLNRDRITWRICCKDVTVFGRGKQTERRADLTAVR